jgi:acetolactate synthase-1/2/3 large subunit
MLFRPNPQAVSPEHAAEINGARLLIEALEAQGVTTIFGYPGGAIMPLYDALTSSTKLVHILARHEQGAALAADGYARVTGRAGVCLATSGPGATNLITGIGNAYMDSVPMVIITGQVATHHMGTDAFQEADIFGMTMSIVKHSYIIRKVEDIPHIVAEAFEIAQSGRPGPVLIDLPKDVSIKKIARPAIPISEKLVPAAPIAAEIEKAVRLIQTVRKPLIYIGGGVNMAGVVPEMRRFVARTGIPVVATLKALGVLPSDDPQFVGMLGMHGLRAANIAVQDCDLLICCGARFDDRVTGKLDTFAPHAKVIHMDIDPAEIGKLRKADVSLTGDMKATLEAIHTHTLDIAAWKEKIDGLKAEHAWKYDAPGEGVYAPLLLKQLSEKAGDKLIVTCDVGQHQMWVAQHCKFSRPEAHLTSGGFGTMGYGLPAGIGAKLGEPDACVVTVSGDGSIMMNIQELATLKRYNIALKIILLDNSALGMVRQWQELFFNQNYSEVDLSDNPDFAAVAKAFGIEAFTVTKRDEVPAALKKLLAAKGPVFMHVKIDPRENVWPLVPPGRSNSDMIESTESDEV